MKRYIYKNEINHIETILNEIDKDLFWRVRSKLFENRNTLVKSNLLFLEESIKGSADIIKSLAGLNILEPKIVTDIVSLFEINYDLEIPPVLEDQFHKNKVVIFVGSGVSANIGYPTWWDFAKKSIDILLENKFINHSTYNDLINSKTDPKQLLSIFESVYKKGSPEHTKLYKETFNPYNYLEDQTESDGKVKEGREIFKLLTHKVFGDKFITTNIDTEIENAYKSVTQPELELINNGENDIPKEITIIEALKVFDKAEIASANFDEGLPKVVHIHGIYTHPESTVFTIKDYAEAYYNKNSDIVKFLNYVFEEFTVLFIGYGLSEFSILEQLINSSKKNKHFTLEPIFFNEMESLTFKSKVFENLKINIIPYFRDTDNYERLKKVLESWKNKLVAYDFFDDNAVIRNAVENGHSFDIENEVISLIRKDDSLLRSFLKRSDDKRWITRLYKEGFFDINEYDIKNTQKVESGEDIVWSQLWYLEKILSVGDFDNTPEVIDITIDTIEKIINSDYNNYWVDLNISDIISTLQKNKDISLDIIKKHIDNLKGKDKDSFDNYIIVDKLLPTILESDDEQKKELLLNFVFGHRDVEVKDGENITYFDQEIVHLAVKKGSITKNIDAEKTKQLLYKFINIVIPNLRSLKNKSTIEFKISEKYYLLKINYIDLYSLDITITSDGITVLKHTIQNYHLKKIDDLKVDFNNSVSDLLDLSKIEPITYMGEGKSIDSIIDLLFNENFRTSYFKLINLEKMHLTSNINLQLDMLVLFLDKLKEKSFELFSSFVKELFESKRYHFPIFRRIALYHISKNYLELNDLFWKKINDYHLLDNYKYDDDVYSLLRNNFDKIDAIRKKQLVTIIEKGPKKLKYINSWQLQWYSLFKEDEEFKEKYNASKQKNNNKDFNWRPTGIVTLWGVTSPVSIKELESKTVEQIVSLLKTFKKEDKDFLAPDEEGLAEALKTVIKNKPEEFLIKIHLFSEVNNRYIHAISSQLEDSVSPIFSNYILSLVDFYKGYIESEYFHYDNKYSEKEFEKAPGSWTVRSILGIFSKILRDDKIEIKNIETLDSIKEFMSKLREIIPQEYYNSSSQMDDYIMFAINNNEGIFYQLVMEISLREGRMYGYKNEKWRYRDYFKRNIVSDIDSANVIIGQYIRNLLWLDENWVKDYLVDINPNSNSGKAFMGGYLFSNPIVDVDIFPLLKPSYEYIIKNNTSKELEGLGNHIANLYFRNLITLAEDDMINMVLKYQPKIAIHFFYALSSAKDSIKDAEGIRVLDEKINELILYIVNRYDVCDDETCSNILIYLYNFIDLFDKQDTDIYSAFISISEKKVNYSMHTISVLAEHIEKDNSLEYAKVLLEIWKNSKQIRLLSYPSDKIFEIWDFITEKITDVKSKMEIRKICTTYVKGGDNRLEEFFIKLADKL